MRMTARSMSFVRNIVILVALFFLPTGYLFAQSRPFPQNVNYPNGYQTSVITANDIQTAYDRWKDLYLSGEIYLDNSKALRANKRSPSASIF